MICNSCLIFGEEEKEHVKSYASESSIEDSLVHDRVRYKQQLSDAFTYVSPFVIDVKPVKIISIRNNFNFTRPNSLEKTSENKNPNCSNFEPNGVPSEQVAPKQIKNDLCLSFSGFELGQCNLSFDAPSPLIRSPQATTISIFNHSCGLNALEKAVETAQRRNLATFFTALAIKQRKLTNASTSSQVTLKTEASIGSPTRKVVYKKWLDANFATLLEDNRRKVRSLGSIHPQNFI